MSLVTADLLKKIGMNVDMQMIDWGTVAARRAKKDAPSKGGWNLFHTSANGAQLASPLTSPSTITTCDGKNFPGWPCDQVEEDMRMQYIREIRSGEADGRCWMRCIGGCGSRCPTCRSASSEQPFLWRSNVTGVLKANTVGLLEHREDMTAFANSRVAAGPKPTSRCASSALARSLVLLPGLGRSSHDLDPFAEHARRRRLSRSRCRIRAAWTAAPGRLDGITLHDLARDIAAVIEALCDGPAVVIGHAFGNRIARCLAADRPELISLVVLLSSSGKVQPTPEIAEAIRLAQAVDTPADIRAAAVLAAWFAPGSDITPWLDGWSQPVMHAYLAAPRLRHR